MLSTQESLLCVSASIGWSDLICNFRPPLRLLPFRIMAQLLPLVIHFSFSTLMKSGLLLYNGRYNHRHDVISLELRDHRAVFSLSLGDETHSISVGESFLYHIIRCLLIST